MGSLERVICFPKIGDRRLAKIGAGGKPLVGDSLRTFGPHEKNLSIFSCIVFVFVFVFVFHYVRVLENHKIPRVLSTEKPLLV